jgi:hypothetical protein
MTQNNRLTAIRATVKIGNYNIEGLYIEQIASFGMQKAKIAEAVALNPKRISELQQTKRGQTLIPKGLVYIGKKVKVVGYNRPIDVLGLDQVQLIWRLAEKECPLAEELIDNLIGLSIHQLFADAFDHHFENEERQAWLKTRQQGKLARRTLTDALAEYITQHSGMSDNEKKYLYANITNKIYQGIFARTAGKLRKDWDITKSKENPRDKMTEHELIYLLEVEELVMRLIDMGWEPYEAVECALDRLMIPVVER